MPDFSLAKVRRRLGGWFTIGALARSYHLTFLSDPGKDVVLPDLMEYTGLLDFAPKDGTEFQRGRLEGRRDVMLHIQQRLRLSEAELFALYANR